MRLELTPRARCLARDARALAPVAAFLTAFLIAGFVIWLMGRSPIAAFDVYVAAAAQRSLGAAGARRQGDAARAHRHRPLLLLPRQSLEHRRRGPVRHRRGARQLARADDPRHGGGLLGAAGHDAPRHRRRRALRAHPGLPEDPLRRQRDPDQPDAGLCRAAHPRLSRARALARPEGLQLPAIRDLRSLRDPAADLRGRAGAFGARVRARSPSWRRP